MFGSRERLYNAWVRDHYRFLFRSAWALTGSRMVAEDVVQDCFELAWRHMDQLRDRALARPWLFQILRREAFRNLAPSAVTAGEPYDEGIDERVGSDAIAAADQRMDILRAMQSLPAIHREVLTLFYFEDMPVSEMALALDVAPGTVLSRLNRARDALRQRMQPGPSSTESETSGRVLGFPNVAARGGRDD
jgi:RNA polymerase sigma factor (sigma-70 family)